MTVEIEGLAVDLDGKRVLDDVSVSVPSGAWLGLIGPNGAGKTTLLRAVAGLVPYQGRVVAAERDISECTRRELARLVAYVPQRPILPQAMTVGDYVLLGRTSHRPLLAGETRRDRRVVARVLDHLEIARFVSAPLGHLSGGELQRAVLARALAQEASILLMDEPTSSLDLGHGQLVLELADLLRREHGLTVLCSMHDLTLAAQYSDRLLVLTAGRPIILGHPDTVLTEQRVREIFEASVELVTNRSGVVVSPTRQLRSVARRVFEVPRATTK